MNGLKEKTNELLIRLFYYQETGLRNKYQTSIYLQSFCIWRTISG